MPFVTRDEQGHVRGIFAVAQFDGQEFVHGDVELWQDPSLVIDAKKQAVRAVRKGILDILASIAVRAMLEGDTDTTAAYLVVVQDLLDITEDWPTDPALVDALVMQRYDALRAKCTPQMVSAFAQVAA